MDEIIVSYSGYPDKLKIFRDSGEISIEVQHHSDVYIPTFTLSEEELVKLGNMIHKTLKFE